METLAPSSKQLLVLSFIVRWMKDHQEQAPTIIEMAGALDLPRNTVAGRLTALRRGGYIRNLPGRWRNSVPTDLGRDYVRQHGAVGQPSAKQ